jgi:hypothetical protein
MKMFRTPVLVSLIACSLMGMNSTFAYASTSMNYNMEMAAKKDKKKEHKCYLGNLPLNQYHLFLLKR